MTVGMGLSPLWLWETFSLLYYGSLLPNPALAKLPFDLPLDAVVRLGASYLWDSLQHDPATLVVTLVSAALLMRRVCWTSTAILFGLGSYAVFLVLVGGDFMSGRMLGAPLVFALSSALRIDCVQHSLARTRWVIGAAIAAYGLLWPGSPWHASSTDGVGKTYAELVSEAGIADERAFYYRWTGLLPVLQRYHAISTSSLPVPPYETALRGLAASRASMPLVVADAVGFFAYFAGETAVVDLYGITDPLLARMPWSGEGRLRAGHVRREIPDGYLESRISRSNLITDPKIAKLYDQVRLVTTGRLLSADRFRAIWRLNMRLMERRAPAAATALLRQTNTF
jgi:arabinofuranosyltransferase